MLLDMIVIHRVLLNSNIRCIEMFKKENELHITVSLNSNIRCIEIGSV